MPWCLALPAGCADVPSEGCQSSPRRTRSLWSSGHSSLLCSAPSLLPPPPEMKKQMNVQGILGTVCCVIFSQPVSCWSKCWFQFSFKPTYGDSAMWFKKKKKQPEMKSGKIKVWAANYLVRKKYFITPTASSRCCNGWRILRCILWTCLSLCWSFSCCELMSHTAEISSSTGPKSCKAFLILSESSSTSWRPGWKTRNIQYKKYQ